jgi:hypothetical protein
METRAAKFQNPLCCDVLARFPVRWCKITLGTVLQERILRSITGYVTESFVSVHVPVPAALRQL